jgi:hypothetical protein
LALGIVNALNDFASGEPAFDQQHLTLKINADRQLFVYQAVLDANVHDRARLDPSRIALDEDAFLAGD